MHLSAKKIPDAQSRAAKRGWKALFEPALTGKVQGEGPGIYGSGGLVVAVRDIFGIRWPND
eukprot:5517865-Heterocapsa_arctica.AAC.1